MRHANIFVVEFFGVLIEIYLQGEGHTVRDFYRFLREVKFFARGFVRCSDVFVRVLRANGGERRGQHRSTLWF